MSKIGGVRVPSVVVTGDSGMRLIGLCVVLGAVALVVMGVVDVLGFSLVLANVVRRLSSIGVGDFGFTYE